MYDAVNVLFWLTVAVLFVMAVVDILHKMA